MKKRFWVGIITVVVILLFLFVFGRAEGYWICDKNGAWAKHGKPSYPSPAVSCINPNPLAKNQADCVVSGGIWKKQGPDPSESCNRKAVDRGNLCRDNGECEGMCQVELTSDEMSQGMRGRVNSKKKYGQCSVWVVELGCNGIMNQGKVQVICIN
jgi:hypothetical protein